MSDAYEYPKLRWPIELRVEHLAGQDVILLTCPLGVAPQPLALTPAMGPIISCFNGGSARGQILERFADYGLTEEILEQLTALIDEHLFLDSPRYAEAFDRYKAEFARTAVRPPVLAGSGYPDDPEELARLVDGYLNHAEGIAFPQRPLTAIVSPHIDYRRGGAAYGAAYGALRDQAHDLFILIGTAHQYSPHMFHLTRKDFTSPFGRLPCDQAFVEQLASAYGSERSFADELLHRGEHSLELQLPFLARLKGTPAIVPILVGGFHHILVSGKSPQHCSEYEDFAAALCQVAAERAAAGTRICFIAGVDLAHVGRTFGDDHELTAEFMQSVADQDRRLLAALTDRDKHAFFAHVAADRDARRLCGFPAIYTVMDVLERLGRAAQAQVFDYRQAVDRQGGCAVTFASAGFYGEPAAGLWD